MYKRKKVILLLTFLIYIIIMFILGLIFICDNVSNGESTVIRYHKFSSNKSTNYEIILTKINDDPEFDVQNGKNGDASAKLYRWWVGTTTVTYSVDVQVSIPKGYTLVSGPTNEGEFSLSASGWGSSETYTTIHECSFFANKYSVKFDGNGNTSGSMSNQSFTYDQAQNLTANGYYKIGYSFAGWSTSANGSVEYSNSQSVSNLTSTNNETVTLYAVWTANTYTVTLNKQSGSGGSRVYTTTKMNSTSGATIYAHWTPNIYKITLDKQSGSGGTNEIYLKYNTAWCSNSSGTATITSITKPTRTGYTFGGYYTDKNGAGTQIINASGSITGSKTYIASGNYGAVVGKISGEEIKYNLVYVKTNGGTSTSSLYTGSTTLSTNLVENNGTRSKVGTEDITGRGKVFNRLLPSAISWGAKVTPATLSDITNWVDKKID